MATHEWSKVMYELYQEEGYNGHFRVVYFTELNDHNREAEINRAMAGRHICDGFISEKNIHEGKAIIAAHLKRLNAGDQVSDEELETALESHAVS